MLWGMILQQQKCYGMYYLFFVRYKTGVTWLKRGGKRGLKDANWFKKATMASVPKFLLYYYFDKIVAEIKGYCVENNCKGHRSLELLVALFVLYKQCTGMALDNYFIQ